MRITTKKVQLEKDITMIEVEPHEKLALLRILRADDLSNEDEEFHAELVDGIAD